MSTLAPSTTDLASPLDRRAPDHRQRRLPARATWRVDGAPVTRNAAEGRPRQGAPDLTSPAPPRRAHDRAGPAFEARGAGVHPRSASGARRDDPSLYARHG